MRRILIVEDERATAWALAERLSEEGFEVETASSAEQALELLASRGWGLVIADVRLPGMDGVQLIRDLGARPEPIPAFAITGRGSAALVRRVLEAGALECFFKPFRVELVVEGARRLLPAEAA